MCSKPALDSGALIALWARVGFTPLSPQRAGKATGLVTGLKAFSAELSIFTFHTACVAFDADLRQTSHGTCLKQLKRARTHTHFEASTHRHMDKPKRRMGGRKE